MDCTICVYARAHGSWPFDHRGTHCGLDPRGPEFDCHRSWHSLAQSHCAECHRHFGSNAAGDAHRIKGECVDPKGFDRWETADGVTWGGRDPEGMRASLRRARASAAPPVSEHSATQTVSVEESS